MSRPRPVRDFAADWKRWTLAERIGAVLVVSVLVLAVLAAATPLTYGGH